MAGQAARWRAVRLAPSGCLHDLIAPSSRRVSEKAAGAGMGEPTAAHLPGPGSPFVHKILLYS